MIRIEKGEVFEGHPWAYSTQYRDRAFKNKEGDLELPCPHAVWIGDEVKLAHGRQRDFEVPEVAICYHAGIHPTALCLQCLDAVRRAE